MEVDAIVSPTSIGKSKLKILAKEFPCQEFIDRVLINPTTLE